MATKKITIPEKRANVFNEWKLACYANNEDYYFATLWTGIPDGDTTDIVVEDLRDGFYDDSLDEMIEMYQRVRRRYESDGFYINGNVYNTQDAIKLLMSKGVWKSKIMKGDVK